MSADVINGEDFSCFSRYQPMTCTVYPYEQYKPWLHGTPTDNLCRIRTCTFLLYTFLSPSPWLLEMGSCSEDMASAAHHWLDFFLPACAHERHYKQTKKFYTQYSTRVPECTLEPIHDKYRAVWKRTQIVLQGTATVSAVSLQKPERSCLKWSPGCLSMDVILM